MTLEPIHDPVFGTLTWDDGFLAWMGKIEWSPITHVEVLLSLNSEDRSGSFRVTRESLKWVRSQEPDIRRLVAEELLDWCNDHFRRQNPVSEAEFLRGVKLHQLRLEDDGSLWVLYYDGHLFGGHVFWAEFGADKVFRGTSVD